MGTTFKTVEVWVCVDQDGDYAVGPDAEAAAGRYAEDVGGGDELGRRMVKISVKIPLPAVIELAGEVAAEELPGGLKVA